MRLLRVGIIIALVLQNMLVLPVAATPSADIVISHVIAGEAGFSNSEFVALYNNSNSDILMNNYCLWSNSNVASGAVACIQADSNTKIYIRSHGYLTIASGTFSANHSYTPDTTYAATNKITVGGDSIYLHDASGVEVDRVTWGTGKLATGSTLQRIETSSGSGVLLDTDSVDPLSDFTIVATAVFPANASYEEVTTPDVCPNIEGPQQAMPHGSLHDEAGNCQPDSCVNIAGLQISVPSGYDNDESGNCFEYDECPNLSGIQPSVPLYMTKNGDSSCIWDVVPLVLTELLPNPGGSDTGNEFIEIYNPSDELAHLDAYHVKVGTNGEKTHPFPSGSTIGPKEFKTFSDADMKFTLVNTTGRVVLVGADGLTYGDSDTYGPSEDDMSWALIGGAWKFTNQPTPAAQNLDSIFDEETESVSSSGPMPCASGKYRHPLTNRCRNIESDAAVLAACDADQYRNPDTGRCRKISVAAATPCKEGQYRSEETNRCRNISTANSLKPCNDNQYRSEETGRCRNMVATSVPDSAFAVQPVKEGTTAFVGWWALGGVSLLAVGYGAWEWRKEIAAWTLSATSFFSGKK